MTAHIGIQPDETLVVTVDAKDIPDAPINYDGDRPAAECPKCDAKVLLWGYDNTPPDVSAYEEHYVQEHILPAIRYEETSS